MSDVQLPAAAPAQSSSAKPLPEPKPGRFLARFVSSRRKCGNCTHFNFAVLQREMQRTPTFVAASQVLSPDKMGVVVGEDGKPIVESNTGASWAEMGACLKHDEGRWCGDVCKDWG